VPSPSPQLISHTTVQHIDNLDFIDSSGLTSSQVPPTDDPHEDLGASDNDDDSLPFLGDCQEQVFQSD